MAEQEKQHVRGSDMVCLKEEEQTICTVHDTTPESNQKKISIIVRPNYTVSKVISDIGIQFSYDKFDLVLQPTNKEESIYLNDKQDTIFYKIPGFVPKIKNILILSPSGAMLSSSELSSVTIQSKVKLSTKTTSIKNTSTSVSNGCSINIEKNVKTSIISNKTLTTQNSLETTAETTKNQKLDTTTSDNETPVPTVETTIKIKTKKCTETENTVPVETNISNTKIESSAKTLSTKSTNNIFKKSPSPKKLIIKKKSITPSENDNDTTLKTTPAGNELKTASPPKKIRKKSVTPAESESENSTKTENIKDGESIPKKSTSPKKVIKKIVKKSVASTTEISENGTADRDKPKKLVKSGSSSSKLDEKKSLVSENKAAPVSTKDNVNDEIINSKPDKTLVSVSNDDNTAVSDKLASVAKKPLVSEKSSTKVLTKDNAADEITKSIPVKIVPVTSKDNTSESAIKLSSEKSSVLDSINDKTTEIALKNDNEKSISTKSAPKTLISEVEIIPWTTYSQANDSATTTTTTITLKSKMVPRKTSKVGLWKADESKIIQDSPKIEPEPKVENNKMQKSEITITPEINNEKNSQKIDHDTNITQETSKNIHLQTEGKIDLFKEISALYNNNKSLIDLTDNSNEVSKSLVDKPQDKIAASSFINSTYELGSTGFESNKKLDLESDDDLALGASASPTEPDSTVNIPTPPALPNLYQTTTQKQPTKKTDNKTSYYSPIPIRPSSGYVGLVNQAMTCYLNSLLQALFMTPEFRNALYKREFDNGKEDKIPYQLQKLFLNLQTSSKTAIETTDLTKSFGWDSTEAWQQHDIQELCRVMFDALEYKFKNTEQANLINILYEGKMIDYVKCLQCDTEKSREDTFLDIPLPVRPFGSHEAYGSIEEALRAFVQPETLDGNNQYFCEKCNKKCDAHKGLKFKKFPYILTLHLKRFDFDYQTLHRIKLNDKVTFPQSLNLNSFVNATDAGTFGNLQNNSGQATNGYGGVDDCSTTDSGAALEEDNCSGIATTASSSHHENDLQDDDEGIDVSSSPDNRTTLSNESGPYIYELFAIMIHSGSASGGHYYAYIKEFENGEWYCFNDQTVTSITQEDIQKSFGGGSFKAYYSSVYSSSTNAYMLMYRQIDPKRNEHATKTDEFPEHITKLLERIGTEEETKRTNRSYESDIIRQKVYFYNPKLKQMKDTKVYVPRDFGLDSALDSAYSVFKVSQFVPISQCRLVAYDHTREEIECSFEGREKEEFGDIIKSLPGDMEFLLETRESDEEFEKYKTGGVTIKVFLINLRTNDLDGPFLVRGYEPGKVEGLKKVIGKKLKINPDELCATISSFYTGARAFVAKCQGLSNVDALSTLRKAVHDIFMHITYFYITLPIVEKKNLEILGIPPCSEQNIRIDTPKQSPSNEYKSFADGSDVVDAVMMNGIVSGLNEMNNCISINNTGSSGDYNNSGRCSPPQISVSQGSSTGSNSEDSSLSDGDRTLVDTNQHGSSQASSTSHSPQLSSPEEENGISITSNKPRKIMSHDIPSDEEDIMELDPSLYLKMQIVDNDLGKSNSKCSNGSSVSDTEDKSTSEKLPTTLKIFVDKHMKVGSLKRAIESYVTVQAEYFKIMRKQCEQLKSETPGNQEVLIIFKEGEQLNIELGREPKKCERKGKIFFIRRSDLNDETGKLTSICEWIFKMGLPVIEAKKQLVAQLHRIDSKLYETLTVENCRLWDKSGRNPIRILADDHKLGSDFKLSINCEFLIQECEKGVSTTTNENSLTVFVRRWRPSKYELGEFQEITLEKDSEVRKMLASISDIPEENISYAKVNSTSFPCTNVSLLTINTAMSWFTNNASKDNYPFASSECGCVFFYRDHTESFKELTAEERKELSTKEKSRLDRVGGATRSLYSPRRERALKIYLDSPPKSSRDD